MADPVLEPCAPIWTNRPEYSPPPWDVLELGCGTGLVGVEIAPHAKGLVGIYIGKLDAVIPAARRALHPGGVLAFSAALPSAAASLWST
jgi:predicted TPR repeat methyltransferase